MWIAKPGTELEPKLEAVVREWIRTKWPFQKVAYPGRDITMDAWSALPDRSED